MGPTNYADPSEKGFYIKTEESEELPVAGLAGTWQPFGMISTSGRLGLCTLRTLEHNNCAHWRTQEHNNCAHWRTLEDNWYIIVCTGGHTGEVEYMLLEHIGVH